MTAYLYLSDGWFAAAVAVLWLAILAAVAVAAVICVRSDR